MNKLALIIGLAPSELPYEDLLIRLRTERTRVREALIRFRDTPKKKTTTRTKKKKSVNLTKVLEELNLSADDLAALFKEEK